MKKLLIIITVLVCSIHLNAQEFQPFNPAKFESDLQQYIAIEAGLTPQEASRFFPLYKQMRRKQRAFFNADQRYGHVDSNDDNACAKAIMEHDKNELMSKKIQQTYHNKFLKVLPASKVFKIIKAENDFHRKLFKRMARRDRDR